MRGTDSTTGRAISGIDHLKQSIRDVLTTRIGSRVMRRDYGSGLFDLIDAPTNQATVLDIIAATIDALLKWEPRIYPQRVHLRNHAPGHVVIDLTALYIPEGRIISIEGITIA